MTAYVSSPARVSVALASGALLGATSWAVAFAAPRLWGGEGLAAQFALLVGLGALVVYVLGLGLLGGPLWLILHELGRRGPLSAVTLGAVLNALPIGLPNLAGGAPTPGEWGFIALAAAIGALVGWVIWRVAYRRAPA